MAWPARRSGKFCGICLVQFGALCAATTDGYNHNNSAPVFHQVLVIRRSILPRRENACSRVKSWETLSVDREYPGEKVLGCKQIWIARVFPITTFELSRTLI